MSMHSQMSLIPNADSRRPCTSATTQATVLRTAAGPSASLELTHDSLPRDRSLFRRSPSSLLPLLDCPPPMDISVHSRPQTQSQIQNTQQRRKTNETKQPGLSSTTTWPELPVIPRRPAPGIIIIPPDRVQDTTNVFLQKCTPYERSRSIY